MYEDEFGFSYFQQKHAERLQDAEKARLLRRIEAEARGRQPRRPFVRRMLASAGTRLVTVGCKLQAAGAR